MARNDTRPDWNAIRAEYIGGGISQRKLAQKHGVPFPTLRDKAANESWAAERDKARNKAVTKAVQKTAEAAASNAALFEQTRAIALQHVKKALEQMPEIGGSHIRRYVQEGGKRVTVDFDLLELVTALDKLERSSATDKKEEIEDDGFLAALSGTAAEDWADEEG